MIKLDNKKNETVAVEKDDEKVQEVQESEFNIYGRTLTEFKIYLKYISVLYLKISFFYLTFNS